MKKFLIGLITGIVLCGLILVILAFSLIRLGSRPPAIADGSTLIMKLNGEVPERAPTEVPIPFFEQQSPLTVADVWLTLRKAAADSRIRAVLFEPENLQIGWARMQELRAELAQFRKSGKPLIALLRTPGTREYYLATAVDRIYMMPEDMLDLKGLRVEAMYFKGSLDKLGIQADVIHAGRFKDYGDVYTRESMTPETREVLNDVLDQFYGDLAATIAGARHKTPEEVRGIVDKGPFSGVQALAAGLIDANGFEDAVASDLQKRLNQSELTKLALRAYVKRRRQQEWKVTPASRWLWAKAKSRAAARTRTGMTKTPASPPEASRNYFARWATIHLSVARFFASTRPAETASRPTTFCTRPKS